MARVKRAVMKRKRKKKIIERASGFWGTRHSNFRIANRAVMKAQHYATRDRKQKKRLMRSLWIVRIGAATREAGLTYSKFMRGLSLAKVGLDRKALAYMAAEEPQAFTKLIEISRSAQ